MKGHKSITGDAAYSPFLISGVGTSVVHAGETSEDGADYGKAFEAYESITRSFNIKVRNLLPGPPGTAGSETA